MPRVTQNQLRSGLIFRIDFWGPQSAVYLNCGETLGKSSKKKTKLKKSVFLAKQRIGTDGPGAIGDSWLPFGFLRFVVKLVCQRMFGRILKYADTLQHTATHCN